MKPQKPKRHKKYKRMSREVFEEMPGAQVIPNKKKYKRKPKHPKQQEEDYG